MLVVVVYGVGGLDDLLVMCMVWHLCGWKCMSQSDPTVAGRPDPLGGHLSIAGW